VQALGSKKYNHSPMSNSLHVVNSTNSNVGILDSTDKHAVSAAPGSDGYEFMVNSNDSQVLLLKKHYERENENDFDGESTIPIKILKLGEEFFDLDWSTYVKHDAFDEYKIYWHCLDTNEHFEHCLNPNTHTYRVKKLQSGFTYSTRIAAIQKNIVIVNKSKYFIIQTSAPPDTPQARIRACNFNYITLEWSKPHTYGEAKIIAYKVYVDGKVEAVLSSDQLAFTLSKGEPCHEYSFQVQAICNNDKFSSLVSPPVLAIWPGVMAPGFRQLENENGMARVAWDEAIVAGNLKVAYYRVVSECQTSKNVSVHGPFESNIQECEIRNMSVGKHKLVLETYAVGITQPFCSMPIFVDFVYQPEAPTLVAQVPGLEQRSKLDSIAASLCNKRDRLLKIITNSPLARPQSNYSKSLIPKAMSTLRLLDDSLNDCLRLIAQFTGYFIVNLTWTCEQPNPMIKLSGYRVYVNDRQYGVDLNSTVHTIRIKLSLEKAVHSVYITAFTDKPKTESRVSNKLELYSEHFFPFSFQCFNNVHVKSAW